MGSSPVITSATTTRKSSGVGGYRGSPPAVHVKSGETKLSSKSRPLTQSHVTGNPASNSSHHRGSLRRFTPSPPSSTHHRGGSGLGAGTGISMARTAPYHSPRNGGGGTLRGSARNSSHSPKESSRSHMIGSLRGVVRSPTHTSTLGDAGSPPTQEGRCAYSDSSSCETSPNRSPTGSVRKPLLLNLNETNSKSSNPVPLERTLSPYQTSPTSGRATPTSGPTSPVLTSHSSLEGHSSPPHPPAPLSKPQTPPTSVSQSPPHTLDFEDGRVLSQLPYEYSSFLDLPPSALGKYYR